MQKDLRYLSKVDAIHRMQDNRLAGNRKLEGLQLWHKNNKSQYVRKGQTGLTLEQHKQQTQEFL